MSVYLPPSLALKSSHFDLYLNYSDDSYSSTQGYVKFDGANVFSPLAKFEVVSANTAGRVHIKCRKNRKFLRRKAATNIFITPEADEAEEDTAKWWCTLFEARVVEAGNTTKVYLFHVQSQYYANAWDVSGVRSLRLNSTTPNHQGIYDIIDLETKVILPHNVAFKGPNGKYLKSGEGSPLRHYPTFTSTDKGISESWFETSTDGHGQLNVMSFHYKEQLYNLSGNWIYHSTVNSTLYSFWPVKVDASTVALKSVSNDKFCIQASDSFVTDGLQPSSTSSGELSRFTIEELVLSRRVYDTNFDLANAIVYGETPIKMANASAINDTSVENTVQLKFTYKESKSTTWTSSHSWMVGVSVSASFKIPFIGGGGEVTANTEYNDTYEWGETLTTETTLETTYTATVPPYSSITVNMMATEGTCDVQYSYYQKDVLYDNRTVIYHKEDGVCKGINAFNFYYEVTTAKNSDLETREQKVPDPSIDATIKILLSDLSEPTTATTSTEEEAEIVQDAAALSMETNQEGGGTVA